MKKVIIILAVSLILGLGVGLFVYFKSDSVPQQATPQESFFDQLGTEKVVQLQIETNLTGLIENRDDKIVEDALLTVSPGSDQARKYPIRVSLRGKTRREICAFPPLKLRFDKDQLKSEDLAPFHKYKLVTHCMDNSDQVLKEYLAYQLYNQLTDYSFRTRLLEITYIDQSGKLESVKQYAILLENYEEMADRLAADEMPDQLPKNTRIPKEDYQRLVLFQYMIGNTDWNLYKQHNIKWLRMEEGAIPVPYDFDFSGFVNASYAKPHPSLPIDNVRERYLQWRGDDKSQLETTLKEFYQKQEELIRLCSKFEELNSAEKEDMLSFLREFFSLT